MRYLSALLLLSAAAYGQGLMPLDHGNQWTYRERGGIDSFTIRVGTPLSVDDRTYYSLTGYGTERLLVRFADTNTLNYYDNVREQEFLLTSFEAARGTGFSAPFRACELQGQTQPERKEFQGPAGRFDQSASIVYQTFSCSDAGILNEIYVPSVGMVQRTVNSIRGPRIYDLVSARVGKLNLEADRGAFLRLALAEQPGLARLTANLDLVILGDLAVALHALGAQEFEMVVRGPDGKVMWQWSDGRAFTPSLRDEFTTGRSWQVEIPLTDRAGAPFPPGVYVAEAWIVSGYERPQFTSSANFLIPDAKPNSSPTATR